jgi:hypothetical protein
MLPIWSQLTATVLVLLKTHQTQGKYGQLFVENTIPDWIAVFWHRGSSPFMKYCLPNVNISFFSLFGKNVLLADSKVMCNENRGGSKVK